MASRTVYHQGFQAVPMSPTPPPGGTYPPPGATAFYVSPTGSDTNAGTFAAPWRTATRAKQRNYTAGEWLLFQRGGEWAEYFEFNVTPNGSQIFTIGAYGVGALPIFHSYRICNIASAWVDQGNNVWRLDCWGGTSTHSGYTTVHTYSGANIGHLLVNDVVYGWKRLSMGELVNQWDFYTSTQENPGNPYLYVKSFGNPTNLAPDLRAAADAGGGSGGLLMLPANTHVRDIHLRGTGGTGIANQLSGGSSNTKIYDCKIGRIGGSALFGFSGPLGRNTVRWGNCFNFIRNMNGCEIYNNECYEAFDTTYTNQLGGVAQNIHIHNNYWHHSAQHFEFWSRGAGGSITGILIEDNDLEDCGYGFGAVTRPEQWNRCCWLSYDWGTNLVQVTSRNNRIKRCFSTYRFHDPNYPFPSSWIFQNNDIQLMSGTKMCGSHDNHTINNGATWAASRNTESGSTYTVL